MTSYKEWKKSLGDTRPWNDIRPMVKTVSEEVASVRYGICEQCPQFVGLSKQCKIDGSLLMNKTKLQKIECPIGKW